MQNCLNKWRKFPINSKTKSSYIKAAFWTKRRLGICMGKKAAGYMHMHVCWMPHLSMLPQYRWYPNLSTRAVMAQASPCRKVHSTWAPVRVGEPILPWWCNNGARLENIISLAFDIRLNYDVSLLWLNSPNLVETLTILKHIKVRLILEKHMLPKYTCSKKRGFCFHSCRPKMRLPKKCTTRG